MIINQYRVGRLERSLGQKHLRNVLERIDRNALDTVRHACQAEVSSMRNEGR